MADSADDQIKRRVGRKMGQPITFDASAELLLKGIRFNEEVNKTFRARHTGIPKGLYHFHCIEDANRHQEACIADYMARLAEAQG